jgi:hypothetical protein
MDLSCDVADPVSLTGMRGPGRRAECEAHFPRRSVASGARSGGVKKEGWSKRASKGRGWGSYRPQKQQSAQATRLA